jgi:hypothetical protein
MPEISMDCQAATRGHAGRAVVVGAMAAALLASVATARADDLGWNGGSAADTPFVGAPGETTWMYKTGSTTATAENPFTYNNGANIGYVGSSGKLLLNTTTDLGGGRINTLQGLRVGQSGAVDFTSIGGPNLRGSGALKVNGPTPLHIEYVASGTGDFLVAGASNRTGTFTWDSTETLQVDGALRVGQGGTGTLTQNDGTIIAGRNPAASSVFAAIGNSGTGTYNLNNGTLQIGTGLDTSTSQEVRRNFRVGAFSGTAGTGTFNLGDGTGVPGSALFSTWDDLVVGHGGGAGTLNLRSDGKISQNFASLAKAAGVGGADAPFVITNGTVNHLGGIVDTDGILQFGKDATAASSYLISGSTGSLNVRALDIGDKGTLGFTFDASGVMKMVIEGDTNTAGDTAKGITFGAVSALNLSSLNLYASNSPVTLIESLDPTVVPAGAFATYAQGQAVGTNSLGTTFYINYTGGVDSNDVVLQTTPLTGGANADFDQDGDVDGADFLAWQIGQGIAVGATRAQGDSNNDAAVNGDDLAVWKSQFGSHAATASAAAVPEPASSAAMAMAVATLFYRKRV